MRRPMGLRMCEGKTEAEKKVADPYEVTMNKGVPSFAKVGGYFNQR
jgi:hypothetical protein